VRYLSLIIRVVRSYLLSRRISNPHPPFAIRLKSPFLKVIIEMAPGARLVVNGTVSIESYFGGNEPVCISLGGNSTLTIDGDLVIGNGTRLVLTDGAELYLGGRRRESSAGITENSRIFVKKKVHIGVDCMVAWGVFVTDCDWHESLEGRNQADVHIGDHVWLAANCSVIKGARIGDNSVIAAHSLVGSMTVPESSFVCGVPGRVFRGETGWRRNLGH
jgi:hypothetical protein